MLQIRVHGRGGQGVVTAAELLSAAAFAEGKHAQAFPSFGSERTGAPVVAFCRIDDRPIRVREPVLSPDALIVQDVTLLHQADVLQGIRPDVPILINATRPVALLDHAPIYTVPATRLALEHIGRPVPNAVLLGGFAAMTGWVSIDSIVSAIEQRFTGRLAAGNAAAAREAYALVRSERQEPSHA